MGILQCFAYVLGALELTASVQPVGRGQVLQPPVAGAAMIEHDVHDEPDAAPAGLRGQFPVGLVRAQPRVHPVVAVVAVLGLRILEHGIEPQLRESHVAHVIEVVDDALQIAPVPG